MSDRKPKQRRQPATKPPVVPAPYPLRHITLEQWGRRYQEIAGSLAPGGASAAYMGPLGRHVQAGDYRLEHLLFDDSAAALRLWNFFLTEERRLRACHAAGKKIVGAMKDLGTVAVLAYSLPNVVAFYPDGAWWAPCIMQLSSGDLAAADSLGIDESFCPVRAMLGAFARGGLFPRPDLLVCSVGATCDDFSAIAQRLEAMGNPILWWEAPCRRAPEAGEEAVELPGGFVAPRSQVDFVRAELQRVRVALEAVAGIRLTDGMLSEGIAEANRFRSALDELRRLVYAAPVCPMGALEMLIAEMLAIHFCSDRQEALAVVEELVAEVRRRVDSGQWSVDSPNRAGGGKKRRRPGKQSTDYTDKTYSAKRPARVFWVNPVADLRAMNLLERCGGRLCGTEFLFSHALDAIPEDLPPMEALARMALADPMVGSAGDRADRICRDARRFGAEAIVVSRIPGASHCPSDAAVISRMAAARLHVPVVAIEVPPLVEGVEGSIITRLEALVENVRGN